MKQRDIAHLRAQYVHEADRYAELARAQAEPSGSPAACATYMVASSTFRLRAAELERTYGDDVLRVG